MKIALFVHCFFPEHFYGTETYTLQLAQNLAALGHDPVVVSAVFPGEPGRGALLTRYHHEGIPVYCIDKNFHPHTRIKDTYYQPDLRPLLTGLLAEIAPDILHVTHLINHTAVLLEAARDLGIPTVATLTDFFGFCFNNKLEAADGTLCAGPDRRRSNCLACYLKARSGHPDAGRLLRMAARPGWARTFAFLLQGLVQLPGWRTGRAAGTVGDLTRRSDILGECYRNYLAVVAPTDFLHKAYVANGLRVPVHKINFGVDLNREEKPPRPAAAPIRFGFIGQIAPHKGTDILLEAFCALPPGKGELVIYGPPDQDPEYMERLRRQAAGHSVAFRGTFPGDAMSRVLAELDFLVIPSTWYENSPLVLLNALASHTPVIVSDVEGLTEFIEEGKNGYAFSRGSAKDLLRVLEQITARPGEARELTRSTEYRRTTATMTRDVLAVYRQVKGESL